MTHAQRHMDFLTDAVINHISSEIEKMDSEITHLEQSQRSATPPTPRPRNGRPSTRQLGTPVTQPVKSDEVETTQAGPSSTNKPTTSANDGAGDASFLLEYIRSTNEKIDHLTNLFLSQPWKGEKPNTTPRQDSQRESTPYHPTSSNPFHSSHTQTQHSTSIDPSLGVPLVARELRKPVAEIDKFDGNPLKYHHFIRQFNARVINNTDSFDERMNYLLQFTSGEANRIARGYSNLRSDIGFDATIEEFSKRYGDPGLVAQSYLTKALEWPPIKADDPVALDAYAIFLKECMYATTEINAMKVLEYTENLQRLISKLPRWMLDKWRTIVYDTRERGHMVRFGQLVEFVIKEARKANDPLFGKGVLPDRTKIKSSSRYTVNMLMNTSYDAVKPKPAPRSCPVCQECHPVHKCDKFKVKDVSDRRQSASDLKLCFNCLPTGHRAKECKSTGRCHEENCGQTHHTLLHVNKTTSPANINS